MTNTINSASHCEYYHAQIANPENPNQSGAPYEANCEDIIKALGLTFDEGCEFKSIWRRGRARQGFVKAESTALRDAAKAVHYAGRVLRTEEQKAQTPIGNVFVSPGIDATSVDGPLTISRYDWSEKPEQFKWAATDRNGYIYFYEQRPHIVDDRSLGWTGTGVMGVPSVGMYSDWRESLEARP